MDAQQSHLGMTDLKKRFGQQAASTGRQDLTPCATNDHNQRRRYLAPAGVVCYV